ncbi:uncharacterized protein LOC112174225 [Rosa chinensis]|nr:uncharacterized protein LOC112167336 [Rosa chinensis]XP_040362199.1 uncharacterized protein LOC112167336 [Rosa chinensis]XP_040364884.1 uncharacterized protein LOC112174225 [Rosa chinensis]XP_040364885.1 uncharacterized protein LOC112174225 [Rosa chinensis]
MHPRLRPPSIPRPTRKAGAGVQLLESEIRQLCSTSKDIFLQQPNLLEHPSRFVVKAKVEEIAPGVATGMILSLRESLHYYLRMILQSAKWNMMLQNLRFRSGILHFSWRKQRKRKLHS